MDADTLAGSQQPTESSAAGGRVAVATAKPMLGLPALDVTRVQRSQDEQLGTYRQLLEILAESERESAAAFPEQSKSLVAHIGALHRLKDDLQDVFTRIQSLKAHFRKEHAEAFDY
ncbi:hypothetical protein IWQ57_001357, partial [Coemansia nantahalensis]